MSNEAACAVCGKMIAETDQYDHLHSNHLGPHYFRLNGRPYRTMHPSLRCMELLQILELPMHGYIWEIRDGKEIDYSHGNAIDLTRQPQLFFELDQSPKKLQTPRSAVERVFGPVFTGPDKDIGPPHWGKTTQGEDL